MQEITLYADHGNAEAIGDMLMEAGASSYTTQDADADTPSESPLFGEPGLEPKVQAWNRLASYGPRGRWFRLENIARRDRKGARH